MASLETLLVKRRIEEAAAATAAKIVAERGEFKPRTSHRWLGRTKGLPFSRMTLIDTIPAGGPGKPATLVLRHPTKSGRQHVLKTATIDLLRVFFPRLPEDMALTLLGHR